MTRRHTRVLVPAMVVCIGLAACGSGESILQAGNPPPPPTTAAPTTLPGQTTVPTLAPTTVPRPIDSLPACHVNALDAAAASGPVKIVFWHGLSNELGRELQSLTDTYNASQSRVQVQLEFQGGYEQTIDKYLQSNTDNRPDLVQMPEYTVQLMVDTKSNIPVQSCMEDAGYDASQLLPAGLNAYATEGIQWAMPFNVSNPVLFFNKKVFRDAGLDDTKPPLTLADVSAYGQAIQQSGAAAYGISLDSAPDGGGGWYLEQWLAKQGDFYSDNSNGRAAPSTKVLFDSPESVALLTELQQVVTTGGGVYVGENPGGQDNLLKLADADTPAAMTISTSAALGPVLAFVAGGVIPSIGPEDLGVGPMPSPSGAPGVLIGGASLWITAGRGDAKAAAAWDYITYLVSAGVQSEWAAATGYVPVNSGAADVAPLKSLYESDPRFRVAFDQVLQAPNEPTFAGPVIGPLREVRVTAAGAVGQILAGADPATALQQAAALATNLISSYNSTRPSG
jgi:sn-glycerol 3-phosphate transport system substrate-binding protein